MNGGSRPSSTIRPISHRPAPLLLNTGALRHLVSGTTIQPAPNSPSSSPNTESSSRYLARAASVPSLFYPVISSSSSSSSGAGSGSGNRSARRDTGVYADAPITPIRALGGGPDRNFSLGGASVGTYHSSSSRNNSRNNSHAAPVPIGLGLGFMNRSTSLSGGFLNHQYPSSATTPRTPGRHGSVLSTGGGYHPSPLASHPPDLPVWRNGSVIRSGSEAGFVPIEWI